MEQQQILGLDFQETTAGKNIRELVGILGENEKGRTRYKLIAKTDFRDWTILEASDDGGKTLFNIVNTSDGEIAQDFSANWRSEEHIGLDLNQALRNPIQDIPEGMNINWRSLINMVEDIDEKANLYDYLVSEQCVAELTGEEFQKDEIPLTEKVSKFYLENYNGKVERIGFGEVVLDKKGIKDSLGHGIGSVKSAAFTAVPKIITDGKIIDAQKNWKGRGKDTYVISAPIKIKDVPYIGNVVVTHNPTDERNRFYLHEVIIQKTLHLGVFQDPPLRRNTETQSGQNLGANNAKVDIPNNDIAKILKKIQSAKFFQQNHQKINIMETQQNQQTQNPTQDPVIPEVLETPKQEKENVGNGTTTNVQKAEDVSESFVQNFFSNFLANLRKKRTPGINPKTGEEYPLTKVDPTKIDWHKLQKQGIKLKDLKDNDLEKLLDGKKTGLINIYRFVNDERIQTKAKISIGYDPRKNEWNKINLNYYNHELKLDTYFDYKFTEEDKKNLLETGNLGKKVDIIFKAGEEPKSRFISVDFDTNEIVSKSAESLKMGNKFMEKDLTLPENQQLKTDLEDGKRVFVKDLQYGVHKVEANVQYNAAKGHFDIVLTEKSQKEISLDRITKEMTMYNIAGDTTHRYKNVEFSEKEIIALSKGETLYKNDFAKKDGTKYSAFVKYDFVKGSLQQISKNSMEKNIKTDQQPTQEVLKPKGKGVKR